MTILHGVTGDTMPGDTEPRRVALRATSDGKLLVDGAGGGGGGGASAEDIGEAVDEALRDSPLPVSGPLTDTQLRATAVPVSGTVDLSNPPSNPPSASAIGDDLRGGAKLPANILMGLGGAKRVDAQAASARVQLATSGIAGVSITAVGAAIRYALGDGTVTASATDHYLPEGQSRDFRVATSQYIAAIRAGDTDAVLEITELSA